MVRSAQLDDADRVLHPARAKLLPECTLGAIAALDAAIAGNRARKRPAGAMEVEANGTDDGSRNDDGEACAAATEAAAADSQPNGTPAEGEVAPTDGGSTGEAADRRKRTKIQAEDHWLAVRHLSRRIPLANMRKVYRQRLTMAP